MVLRIGSFASSTSTTSSSASPCRRISITKLWSLSFILLLYYWDFTVDFTVSCGFFPLSLPTYHQLLEESVVMSTFCVSYQLVELLRREEGMQSSNNNTISTHLSKNQLLMLSSSKVPMTTFSPINFHDIL